MNTARRQLLALPLALLLPARGRAQTTAALPPLQVWKDPSCGCCQDWIAHLQAEGFSVQVHDSGNSAVRRRLGLPERYASCHTGLVAGYVIEGHVNAREIRRLLADKPAALGLAVPGMPVGSPGMDGPIYGGRQDPYEVLLVQRDGTARVYQSYFQPTAQASAQASEPTPATALTEGEVRRVNRAAQEVTLRHGAIPNLGMPPMTMVFKLRDPALLGRLKPGDRVRFTADQVQGVYTLRTVKPLQP